MNVCRTPEYQAYRHEFDAFFCEACRARDSGGEQKLAAGYSLRSDRYRNKSFQFCLSRHRLLDSEGETVYAWDNINNDGEFASLISHINGKHYLVFREDLYGYSVLEVESGAAVHYVPEESWPLDGRMGKETFIWTNAAYDPASNLLAVWGCFWACPNSMVFLDFSDPMAEQDCGCWVEMHEVVDPGYDRCDDIDMENWDVRGWMRFRCTSATENTGWQELLVPRERIMDAVREKKLTYKERE